MLYEVRAPRKMCRTVPTLTVAGGAMALRERRVPPTRCTRRNRMVHSTRCPRLLGLILCGAGEMMGDVPGKDTVRCRSSGSASSSRPPWCSSYDRVCRWRARHRRRWVALDVYALRPVLPGAASADWLLRVAVVVMYLLVLRSAGEGSGLSSPKRGARRWAEVNATPSFQLQVSAFAIILLRTWMQRHFSQLPYRLRVV